MSSTMLWGMVLFTLSLNAYMCADTTDKKLSQVQMYFYGTLLLLIIVAITEVTTPTGGIATNILNVIHKGYSMVTSRISKPTVNKYSFKPTTFQLGPIQKAAIIRALVVTGVIFLVIWLVIRFLKESSEYNING